MMKCVMAICKQRVAIKSGDKGDRGEHYGTEDTFSAGGRIDSRW